MLDLVNIEATDLNDAWFQCVYQLLDRGRRYTIDHGSYAGDKRLEFDYVTVHIKHPGVRPLLPQIPAHLGIPDPVEEGYLDGYISYLMTNDKQPNEDYTYGERLAGYEHILIEDRPAPADWGLKKLFANQIEEVINMYKTKGYGTNQAAMSISCPTDIKLEDPPCLRHIDTRISDGKLHFMVYFRSWDLWNGFPANLGGIQLLKEYMSAEIGVEDGEIVASSKGLHLYKYVWELAQLRAGKGGK